MCLVKKGKREKPASEEPLVMIRPLTLTPAGWRVCDSEQMESFDTHESGRARHDLLIYELSLETSRNCV